MFKFGGFKASLNFYNGMRKNKKEQDGVASVGSITGAYRTNRDEFYEYNNTETQRKTISSELPPALIPPEPPLRKAKSASNLIRDKNLPPNLQQSNQDISKNPRGTDQPEIRKRSQDSKTNTEPEALKRLDAEKRVEKKRIEEQKRLEKQNIDEQSKLEKQQKKQEKLALQERAKAEKLVKEKEKKETQKNKRNKKTAPQVPLANPLAQANAQPSNNLSTSQSQSQQQFSTNTLESSISKSSGPPPYTNARDLSENDASNITFSKPMETSSWDMISQHRDQINRPMVSSLHKQKQTTMDLNYRLGEDQNNSEV